MTQKNEKKSEKSEVKHPLYLMSKKPCPPGECDVSFAEVNSYGTMYKCAKCGCTDFAD